MKKKDEMTQQEKKYKKLILGILFSV